MSNNDLSYLPNDVVAPSIHTLLISNNKFRRVPSCICSFLSLQHLDISDNPDILSLPVEMGRLQKLHRLVLTGLKDLSDPPRNMHKDAKHCIRYLNSKLRAARSFFRMKLMLVGKQNRGKTTLVARLRGLEVGPDQATDGVDVSEWSYASGFGRRRYHFSIWDFGGQEEYYATHQCFLSERSMYLLLFNLKQGLRDGEACISELKPWLDNITLRAPQSCVLIVGTHLDEVEDAERPEADELLTCIGNMATQYQQLQVKQVLPVGLMNRLEGIADLRDAIYENATEYKGKGCVPVMGQEIPASYFQLNRELERIQENVRRGISAPVMHAEEFKDLVQQLKLPDIFTNDEVQTATLFLNEVGTILHYNDRSHNLNELYFIDPRWLCDMMSQVVTVKEKNPYVKNGILHSTDIPVLFKDKRFPWEYFEQYLTLLDRFEIALPLDNKRILIPSMLSEKRPANATLPEDPSGPYYRRYIVFQCPCPPGFWSRLISRVMHTVPQIRTVLDAWSTKCKVGQENPSGQEVFSATFNHSTYETSGQEIKISPPMHLSSTSGQSPFLLPNIHSFIISDEMDEELNPDEVEIPYWREGIVYRSPDLNFCVEALKGSQVSTKHENGILLMTSPSGKGTKTICLLVDMILSLIHDWYPGLVDGLNRGIKNGVWQIVPCYECLIQRHSEPFEFRVDEHMFKAEGNPSTKIKCSYDTKNPSNNHVVSLAELMPDLLLQDLHKGFLLSPGEVIYQEDKESLLGVGGFGKVYRGHCRGKSVAIKKYITKTEKAFNEFRSEAKVLQKSHHPCLVCLVGVCLHPSIALVLEEAPMGSLDCHLIKRLVPIPRIVMFRMATEVAAALRFLHQHGIIFRDLKAANVLLWSLEEESLCHCKVTDFGIATHQAPFGALGLEGTIGFIAPEVLFLGKKKTIYNHKADIFSFGMLLYQMIARCHPFHDIPVSRIGMKIVDGERPSLVDVTVAETGYLYLTRLMKECWNDQPKKRPDTDVLISRLSNMTMIMIMGVNLVQSRFSLRRGCAITSQECVKANANHAHSSQLWICCDGLEGAELNIFKTNCMVKLKEKFIKGNQVQCMSVCGDNVWVCSRPGIGFGIIDIYSITSQDHIHRIKLRENSVCCMTATEEFVYLGTFEGYVFIFSVDVESIEASGPKPHHYKYVNEYPIDGIAVTQKHVWVSHTKFISFLNLDTLEVKCQLTRGYPNEGKLIGTLSYSRETDTVWSAHLLRGFILSAWNAGEESHMYDINTRDKLLEVEKNGDIKDDDAIMTCMTPVLDTVWVGMATGHIMMFHKEELKYYVRPYKEYIRFLIPIPCEGPTQKEKCMVVSGAKCFQSPVPESPIQLPKVENGKDPSLKQSGVLILWEAFTGEALHQMSGIESEAPYHLDNHRKVANMIRFFNFRDDTHTVEIHTRPSRPRHQLEDTSYKKTSTNENGFSEVDDTKLLFGRSFLNNPASDQSTDLNDRETGTFQTHCNPSLEEINDRDRSGEGTVPADNDVIINKETKTLVVQSSERSTDNFKEVFDVEVSKELFLRISCSKPVKLDKVLSEIGKEGNFTTMEMYNLAYHQSDSGELIDLTSQDDFDHYLEKHKRPKLVLIKK